MGSANNVLRGGQGRTSLPSADLRMTRYLQASRRWSCFSWRWGSACNLGRAPLEREYDPLHRRAMASRSPAERLALGISWNRMAGRLSRAGRQARGRA